MSNFPQNSNLNQGLSSYGNNIPSTSFGSQPLTQGGQGFSQPGQTFIQPSQGFSQQGQGFIQPSQGFTQQPGVALIQQRETVIQPLSDFNHQGQGFTQPGQQSFGQQAQKPVPQDAGYVWSNAYDQGQGQSQLGSEGTSGHKKGLLEKIGLKKSHDTDQSGQDQNWNQGMGQGTGQGMGQMQGQSWNQQPGMSSNLTQTNQGFSSYGQPGATDIGYLNQGQGLGTNTGSLGQVQPHGQGSTFQNDNYRNIEQQQMNPQGQAQGHGLGGMLNTAKSEFQSITHHQGTQPQVKGTLGTMDLGNPNNQENLGMGAYNQMGSGLQPQTSGKNFSQPISGSQPFSTNQAIL